ncbi:TF29 protein, partial [Crocuta crocuta]
IAIPEALAPAFVKQFHQETHIGWTALETTLSWYFYIPRLSSIARVVCEQCETCARDNPRQGPKAAPGVQSVGGAPFENVMVDFTELPRVRGCKYLLVFVCAFSGWVEAFPTRTENVREVARLLIKEIIPRFGIPITMGSDNGPAFVAEVGQLVAKGLKITWKLHTAPRPQSSGKVGR